MEKTDNIKQRIERNHLSRKTIDVISEILSFESQPVNAETKSDLVKLAIYSKNEDAPGSKFDFYIHWINDFTDELLKGLSEEPPKEELQDCVSDTAIKMIQELIEGDPVYIKTDILHLYQWISLRLDGCKDSEKDGPLMLIVWLNRFFDSVYMDLSNKK